jgi:sulfite dehydrogenase
MTHDSASLGTLPRRRWLAGTALGALGLSTARAATEPVPTAPTGAAPTTARTLPAYAAGKDADSLVVHSSSTLETRRSAFGTSVITPTERLYVRNNLPAPSADILKDREAWRVQIDGVRQPRTLSLAELRLMGVETVATVLQCSGNGRGFFPAKPSGTPWTVGAAGCVLWSGVPLRRVVEALGGVAEDMRYITGTGGESLPEGVDPKSVVVERSVPLAALDDALLAWEMNGAPLSLAHGGPLRLVLPGYQGVNNIKYLKTLAFTARESQARIMSHGYRLSPPGTPADPGQASVQEMSVKSWINGPLAEARAGLVQIHGVAFGGRHAVRQVEVSVDGGRQWQPARFVGPDLGRFAWRQFVLEVRLPAGEHRLVSRATDSTGQVQPELRLENASGYNNTSWQDHGVSLRVL